ncbi:MAG: hypothetical protein ACM3SQ_20685 [Betaproteobacteria bacterium]
MLCPLCGRRKARRACPALNQTICAVCCGSKRLGEIQCTPDCAYLASSREHPPAAAVRRQERDVAALVHIARDLNERQSKLLFVVAAFLLRYTPPELQPLIDDDVAEAAAALAATLETSVRGVIYEHRSASLPAERLAGALRPLLAEAGKGGGTAFERDAAVVLRRIEEAAREPHGGEPESRRTFLDLLARVIRRDESGGDEAPPREPEPPRLIVP